MMPNTGAAGLTMFSEGVMPLTREDALALITADGVPLELETLAARLEVTEGHALRYPYSYTDLIDVLARLAGYEKVWDARNPAHERLHVSLRLRAIWEALHLNQCGQGIHAWMERYPNLKGIVGAYNYRFSNVKTHESREFVCLKAEAPAAEEKKGGRRYINEHWDCKTAYVPVAQLEAALENLEMQARLAICKENKQIISILEFGVSDRKETANIVKRMWNLTEISERLYETRSLKQ